MSLNIYHQTLFFFSFIQSILYAFISKHHFDSQKQNGRSGHALVMLWSVPVYETRSARPGAPPRYVCWLPPGKSDGGKKNFRDRIGRWKNIISET